MKELKYQKQNFSKCEENDQFKRSPMNSWRNLHLFEYQKRKIVINTPVWSHPIIQIDKNPKSTGKEAENDNNVKLIV